MYYRVLIAMLLFSLLESGCLQSQDMQMTIGKIDHQLKNGETTLSDVLSNDTLIYLHSLTAFREMIKSNAPTGDLMIVSDKEPGEHITVKGTVVNKAGDPMKNVEIYLYQTSSLGWYSDTAAHILINSGDFMHARLFGYVKTNDKGGFTLETIKPAGYPRSSLPGHIHVLFTGENGLTLSGTDELLFDDDPRMTWERKKQSLEEGKLISRNSGPASRPVYEYLIVVQ